MPVPIPSYLNVEITRAGTTTVVEFLIIPDEIWHAGDFKAGVRNLDPKDRDLQYIASAINEGSDLRGVFLDASELEVGSWRVLNPEALPDHDWCPGEISLAQGDRQEQTLRGLCKAPSDGQS
jgi:hypothetical protein